MSEEILSITPNELSEYAKIPIAFDVRSKFEVQSVDNSLGSAQLREVEVEPYIKDYDALGNNKPTDWPKRFNVATWGLFLVRRSGIPVGGAAIALNTPEISSKQKSGSAVLWDLRVHPDYRGSGLGKELFQKAVAWAKSKGCTQLRVETQNTNVGACKFYAQQGCKLGEIDRFKYSDDPDVKDEVMLVWYLDL